VKDYVSPLELTLYNQRLWYGPILSSSVIDPDSLNAPQWEAVKHTNGPLLILAGAGSGKTRVITFRVAQLIHHHSVSPGNILSVTFTNKAADEMKARIAEIVGLKASGLQLGTFHGFCVNLLRRFRSEAYLPNGFTIFDGDDQLQVIKSCMKELGVPRDQVSPVAVRNEISRAKDELRTSHQYAEFCEGFFQEVTSKIYSSYQNVLSNAHGLDFGDLIMSSVRLLRESSHALDFCHERYRYIQVDEYQDTNRAQYALIRELASARRNLAVVGDDDQSIYGWRGADIRNLLDFEAEYPDSRVIKLEQNYRSTQMILDAAHHVVSRLPERKEKHLWTDRSDGSLIKVIETYDEEDEAIRVLTEIQNLIAAEGCLRGDFAIMYRTNAQSRPLEECFVKAGLPYQLVGGTEFYSRREIKDLLAYLRVVSNPQDDVSLERVVNVPSRGIGEKTLNWLKEWAASRGVSASSGLRMLASDKSSVPIDDVPSRALKVLGPVADLLVEFDDLARRSSLPYLIEQIFERSGYKNMLELDRDAGADRIENVMELIAATARYADGDPLESLIRYLQEVALVSDVDRMRVDADSITLITLHAAKGLEFKNVFLVGFEEEYCPHFRSFHDPLQMEEERRLAYVGITRAIDRLYLTYARFRGGWGSRARLPSRFIQDIPDDLLETIGRTERVSSSPSTAKIDLSTERSYSDGQKVCHPVFGKGIVISGKIGPSGDEEVQVAFADGGIKLLSVSFANLERM